MRHSSRSERSGTLALHLLARRHLKRCYHPTAALVHIDAVEVSLSRALVANRVCLVGDIQPLRLVAESSCIIAVNTTLDYLRLAGQRVQARSATACRGCRASWRGR